MEKDYNTVTPVLQDAQNLCWAACMQWWLTYMPDRAIIQQADFFAINYIAEKVTDSEGLDAGGLTRTGIQRLMEYPDFRMTMESFAIGELKMGNIRYLLGKSPILIGFSNPNGKGKHFNVIVKAWSGSWGGGTMVAMEPATGRFENRFLAHYTYEGAYLGYASS